MTRQAEASSSSATPAWELSKENAAPLQRGRNVAVLEQSLLTATTNKISNEDRDQSIQHFERLVAPSEQQQQQEDAQRQQQHEHQQHTRYHDDDPLIHWLSYIKYYQDNFPSDTHAQFLLMERCTRALVHVDRYANDIRFIRVCAAYADKTSFPRDVFKYLYQQNVGIKVSLFWMAWAWVAEHAGDHAFCEKVFKKGLHHQAQPLEALKQRYAQFLRRMSRHWLNTSQQHQQVGGDDFRDEEEEDLERRRRRDALKSLDEEHIRRNDRSSSAVTATTTTRATTNAASTFLDRGQTVAGRERERPTNNGVASGTAPFPIFVESNDRENSFLDQSQVHNGNPHRVLERDADRKKENTQKPEPWNERPGGYTSMYPASVPSHLTTQKQPPVFAIHVDEECANKHEREEQLQKDLLERRRRDRDERTFRERADGGMAEKLANDPLRYVRNPSKLDADQAAEQCYHQRDEVAEREQQSFSKEVPKAKSTTLSVVRAKLLETHCCFEMARAANQGYHLLAATTNFNHHMTTTANMSVSDVGDSYHHDSTMELDESCSVNEVVMNESCSVDDVVMKDVSSARPPTHDRTSSLRQGKFHSLTATKQRGLLPKRVLFSANGSFDSQTTKTVSSACSSVNDREKGPDETVNTKFAVKELSVMFASPAFLGLNDRRRNDNDDDNHLPRDRYLHTQNSQDGDDDDDDDDNRQQSYEENDGTAAFPGVGSLLANDVGSGADAAVNNINHSLVEGPEKKENRGPTNPLARSHTTPGFESMALKTLEGRADDRLLLPTCGGATATAAVELSNPQEDPFRRKVAELSLDPGFEIFCDDQQQDDRKPSAIPSFPREKRRLVDTSTAVTSKRSLAFAIYKDDDADVDADAMAVAVEEKGHRSTSLHRVNEHSLSRNISKSNTTSLPPKGAFAIWTDEQSQDQTEDFNHPMEIVVTDGTAFGDISQIEGASPSIALSVNSNFTQRVDYTRIHQRDIHLALQNLSEQAELSPRGKSNNDLLSLLSTPGLVCHIPNQCVPRALQGKALTKGAEIKLGHRSGVVKGELGRGAYGVVALLGLADSIKGGPCAIAVKIQSPTDSLALEYEILQKIEARVGPKLSTSETFPFPRSLSFVTLSDGGLLSMTAGSATGLNLVDLSNVYRVQERGSVPEIIALHYTTRMLKHVEVLHFHGKILHCDAKPDNWVMVASAAAYPSCRDSVAASDLMLVDFGRAVDLTTLSGKDGSHEFYPARRGVGAARENTVRLWGNASGDEDMACVAMRQGMGWSYDVDTFGICASAHVLLFGCHMEIVQDVVTKRWRLSKPLRRYWQQDLWQSLFDALLNHSSDQSTNHDSSWLRSLRTPLKMYLKAYAKDLDTMLKHQARLLPTKRPG